MLYNHENNQLFHSFYIYSKSSLSEWHDHIRELFWGKVMYFPNLYIVECLSAAFFFWLWCYPRGIWDLSQQGIKPIPPALEMGSLHFWWSGSTSLDHQGSHLLLNVDHYLIVIFVTFLFSSKLCSYQFILRRVLRSVMFFFLDLKSANFFWKDPDRKYFRLCRQYSLLQLKCWSTHRQVNK